MHYVVHWLHGGRLQVVDLDAIMLEARVIYLIQVRAEFASLKKGYPEVAIFVLHCQTQHTHHAIIGKNSRRKVVERSDQADNPHMATAVGVYLYVHSCVVISTYPYFVVQSFLTPD